MSVQCRVCYEIFDTYHQERAHNERRDRNNGICDGDARYQWLRRHPAFETEAVLSDLTPEQFDKLVGDFMDNGKAD